MASDPYTLTILKIPKDELHDKQLAKSYAPNPDGGPLIRTEYDAGMFFRVSQKRVPTIREWANFQKAMAAVPFACIIRGEPDGVNLQRARRLQTAFPDVPRNMLLFDLDKPKLRRGIPGVEQARLLLPPAFHNAPCWWQRTGSYGVNYEGRDPNDGPWDSKLRLGFMLDKPLTTPQIKYWLREHRKIVDLAIYTSNQINYTANPTFTDGAIDPVLAAGEARFGTLDLDDALVDEVIVPDEITNYVPSYKGTVVDNRPATISGPKRELLIELSQECDAEKGERHGSLAQWAFDAYGLGMDEQEIVDLATTALVRLGREPRQAAAEAERFIPGAKRKMEDGTLSITAHLREASGDFDPIPDGDPLLAPTVVLSPAQTAAQLNTLIPWQNRLKVSPSTGAFKVSLDNTAIILGNHSSFLIDGVNILAHDAFRDMPVWTAPPPWWRSRPSKTLPTIGELGHPITDEDAIALAVWIGHLDPASGPEGTPISIGKNTAMDAILHVARYRTVNPVHEYMEQAHAKWDKVDRLDRVLTEVCHAPPSKIVPCWFRKWMMQVVARVYNPGAKCDGVLILQGGQGAKKSTFFRNLCPFEQLFFEGTLNFRDKDSMQDIQGKLIVEMAELSGTKKDIDIIKSYITKQDDTYRSSYGRMSERRQRRTVFCGTTNDEDSLTDTGRRWWIVEIPDSGAAGKTIDLARTKVERDLWWGEAVARYKANEEWWLTADEDTTTRSIAQEHGIGLEMSDEISQWLSRPANKGGAPHTDVVHVKDIWCGPMSRTMGNMTGAAGREISRLMAAVGGWKRERVKLTPVQGVKIYLRKGSKLDLDRKALKDYLLHHNATSPDFAENPAA